MNSCTDLSSGQTSRVPAGFLPVLLLGLILRVAWTLVVPVEPVSDSAMYDTFAREIASGRGYIYPDGSVTAYWPVGASALYGLAYSILGAGAWTVLFINLVLGVGIIALTHLLAYLRFGPVVGLVAGVLVAVWPLFIQFTTILNSELPFLLLLLAALTLREYSSENSWTYCSLAAALLAASAYMRPTSIPLIMLLPLVDLLRHRNLRAGLIDLAITICIATALIAPWAWRNHEQLGAPVLISTNFGPNLWMGNNPKSSGAYMPLPHETFEGEVRRDQLLKERALDFITAHPGQYFKLCANRLWISFSRETIGVVWNEEALPEKVQTFLKIISSGFWLAALACSLAGLFLFVAPHPIRLLDPIVVCPALSAAAALLIVGQDRYHVPLNPFVAIFAAYALRYLLEDRRSKLARSRHGAPPPAARPITVERVKPLIRCRTLSRGSA